VRWINLALEGFHDHSWPLRQEGMNTYLNNEIFKVRYIIKFIGIINLLTLLLGYVLEIFWLV